MTDTDAALVRARLRLARSRQALLEQMRLSGAAGASGGHNDSRQGGLWHDLVQAWQQHPAWLAAQALAPLLREQARRHPWQLLALSGLLGAALMLLRPWRLLPVLLVTAARSVPLSQLLAAWLHQRRPAKANRTDQTGPPGRPD